MKGLPRIRPLEVAVVLAAAATFFFLATDLWPQFRGPENWRWERRLLEAPAGLLLVVAIWAFAAFLAWALRSALAYASSVRRLALLGGAALVVFLQMVALSAIEPGGLSNVPRRVMDPSFTSYHTVASEVEDPLDFLRRYHRLQGSFPVHGPSQPPGRVLFFWAINQLASEPGPTRFLLNLGERLGGVPAGVAGMEDGERAGAVAAGYLLMLLGALCVMPIFVLAGARTDTQAGSAAVLLMSSLPSYLLFTPQTDHIVLLASLGAAALALAALRRARDRGAIFLALAAGVSGSIGVFFSFTELAALGAWGLAILGGLILARRRGEAVSSSRVTTLALASIAGLLVVPAITSALGMNWREVFRESLAAAQRVQVLVHGREYSTWVTWNLWDFSLFLGPGLFLTWLGRVPSEVRVLARLRSDEAPEIPFALALAAALLMLDVSGAILGETGRIWMFLMPFAVCSAARAYSSDSGRLFVLAGSQLVVLLSLRMFLNVPG